MTAMPATNELALRVPIRLSPAQGMPPCPICGSPTFRDRTWDGIYTRTLGWRCRKGGLSHFLEAKARRIRMQLARNPWLLRPAPGYPGVRRDQLLTWQACTAFNRMVFLTTGYDPTI